MCLAEVDHLHLIGLAAGQHECQVTGRLPPLLAAGRHRMEVENVEANELNQDNAFVQPQGDGAAVGLAKLLFEVHFGDLPGQFRFALLLLLPHLVQGLLVDSERFAGSRPGKRLLRDAPAQLGELLERLPQMRLAPTEDRIPLRRQGFRAESLAAKDEIERQTHRFGRERQVSEDQGQEAILVVLERSYEEQTLLIGTDGKDLADHAVLDGHRLAHQLKSLGDASRCSLQKAEILEAGSGPGVVVAQHAALRLQALFIAKARSGYIPDVV
jgi:hypothetical protein